MSLRRTAEFLRSWLGRQERWRWWRPLDTTPAEERCYLAASTVHRWLNQAGVVAQASVAGQRELIHLVPYYAGLQRVTPEWYWRDFRFRLSRGWNHGSEPRLERAALVWAIYHNFEPAQWRSERKRHYRYPGQSPLQVAGVPPGPVSYLDALGV